MTEAILEQGGTLAGFRGDGLMAVFGAPLPQEDHARRAINAAREMAGPKLEKVNDWVRREEIGDDLAIGVGVCSGVVMAGNVGSEERMEFTVVGMTANIAARLESMTKGTPHRIYVADSTHALLGPAADGLAEVGDLDVRGARTPVKVWADLDLYAGEMAAAIETEGLRKNYGDVCALDGVDLRAEEGTVLGLLGPNGAGKTTAVRILSTLLKPDAGPRAWPGSTSCATRRRCATRSGSPGRTPPSTRA